jgi:TPR repeat protein
MNLMDKRSSAWKKYEQDLTTHLHIEAGLAAEGKGDINLAIQEFEKAAIRKSIYARGKLGTIFDDVATPPQPKRAIYWYKAGVRLGDSSCAWDLAMHYSNLRKKRWYRYWLNVAEQMGEIDATEELRSETWWNKHNPKGSQR